VSKCAFFKEAVVALCVCVCVCCVCVDERKCVFLYVRVYVCV